MNRRRARLSDPIRDIASAFQKMSTESNQAHVALPLLMFGSTVPLTIAVAGGRSSGPQPRRY